MKNYRSKELYKRLNSYMATAYAEVFCEGEGATEDEQLTAWQYLHDNGHLCAIINNSAFDKDGKALLLTFN